MRDVLESVLVDQVVEHHPLLGDRDGLLISGLGFGLGFGLGTVQGEFRDWSLGFGIWGLGFGVWGVGFGVRGLSFGKAVRVGEGSGRLWDLGFRVWGVGVWSLGLRIKG